MQIQTQPLPRPERYLVNRMSVLSPQDSLDDWLGWLEKLHPTEIDMGLDRVGRVADTMALRPASVPVILVGGTNGKGSTVTLLAEIYAAAGYRAGTYTSPHIDTFNERMCVNNEQLSDAFIVDALYRVEQSRQDITLTYFEYTTLAAMVTFHAMHCDVAILEVGLGGRLDATNLWDADCAILTSIALDHQEYLGDTRELIAAEKIAIGRAGKPLIVGELDPPDNLEALAAEKQIELRYIDSDNLPVSGLPGEHQRRNAACALAAVEQLQNALPVAPEHIAFGLNNVQLPGRFEQFEINGIAVVLDVAHNPAAAQTVREALALHYSGYRVHAVFSCLKDKNIVEIAEALAPAVAYWYCAGLDVPRATPVSEIAAGVRDAQTIVGQSAPIVECDTVADAWRAASAEAKSDAGNSVILIAGSFYTLSDLRDIDAFGLSTA